MVAKFKMSHTDKASAKGKSLAKQAMAANTHPSNDDLPSRRHKSGFGLSSAVKETRQFIYNILGEYSLKHENFLGVDITPHYIRLCQMDHSKKKPVLKNLASACIENNYTLDDIFSNPNTYIENLSTLVEKEHLKNREIVLSVPVSGAIIRTLYIADMSDEELQKPETVKSIWHVSLAMDIDVSEYAISIQVISRGLENQNTSKPGKMMEVLLVAVRQSILTIFTHIAKSAGLKPSIAVLRCFALENALTTMRKQSNNQSQIKTEAFLEFGVDENYLFIPDSEGVSTYEIYLSHQDRMSLAKNNTTREGVETLSQDYAKQISKIINLHQKDHLSTEISNIFVTSSLPLHMKNPSEMPIISSFISQLSTLLPEYNVSECNFCDSAEIAEQYTDTVNAEGRLSAWVVTMGLATSKLDAFGRLKQLAKISNMNMLPEAVHLKKAERIKVLSRGSAIAALGLLLAIAGISYTTVYNKGRELNQAIAPLSQIEQQYNTEMSKLERLRTVKDKIDALDKVRTELPSNQLVLLSAYQYLGKTIPDGIWLKEVTFESPNSVTIVGNSVDDQNILEFVNALNKSEQFNHISLKTMQAVKEMTMNAQQAMAVKKFELGGEFVTGKKPSETTAAGTQQ